MNSALARVPETWGGGSDVDEEAEHEARIEALAIHVPKKPRSFAFTAEKIRLLAERLRRSHVDHTLPSTAVFVQSLYSWGDIVGSVEEPWVTGVCSGLRSRIARASKADDPLAGATTIDEIREQAEEIARTGEAHLRDLLLVIPLPPERCELPGWARQLEGLGPDEIHPKARESLFKILRALPVMPVVEPSVSHDAASIRVSWDVPSRLTWVFSPPRYRWPSVNVRVHQRIKPDKAATKSRTVLLAHRLIAEAAVILA